MCDIANVTAPVPYGHPGSLHTKLEQPRANILDVLHPADLLEEALFWQEIAARLDTGGTEYTRHPICILGRQLMPSTYLIKLSILDRFHSLWCNIQMLIVGKPP